MQSPVLRYSLVHSEELGREELVDAGSGSDIVVGAHVALGDSWVEGGLVKAGHEGHSLGVDLVEVLVGDGGLTSVDPDSDEVGVGVAPVVDRVASVVSVEDGQVRLFGGLASEGDVAGGAGVAVSLGVHTNSGSPEAENLGLEGVVDLEVLDGGVSLVISQVSVRGLGALVELGLLWVLHVHLLVPVASVFGLIEVLNGDDWVAGDWGVALAGGDSLGNRCEHCVLVSEKF